MAETTATTASDAPRPATDTGTDTGTGGRLT